MEWHNLIICSLVMFTLQRKSILVAVADSYEGCFSDDEHRLLPSNFQDSGSMTIEYCENTCRTGGYLYAGLEFYQQCFCGNSKSKHGYRQLSNSECNYPCKGNTSQMCGGEWKISIYKVCPHNIDHCIDHRCNSLSDVWCQKCEANDLYKLGDNNRKCLDQCSWKNRWCWPGNCTDNYARNCKCEANFRRVHTSSMEVCQPLKKPEILTCRMRVVAGNNDMKESPAIGSSACKNQQDFHGNMQIDHVVTTVKMDYSVSTTSHKPSFVHDHVFGVTDVYIILLKRNKQGVELSRVSKTLQKDPSSSSPASPFDANTNITNNLSDRTLQNGQSLCLLFHAKGGGFLMSHNVRSRIETKIPFDKTMDSRTLCYYYDDAKPVCFMKARTCHEDPLRLDNRLTTDRQVTVTISQWIDPVPIGGSKIQASGIESYAVTVYELREEGPSMLDRDNTPIIPEQYVNSSFPLELPEKSPALYEISLEVKDVADNVRYVRRLVLYDNSTTIDVIPYNEINVVSATNKTTYKWQTNLNDICVSWTNRYHNMEHEVLLRPVKPDGRYTGIYEQQNGQLPVNGTHNVHGITTFRYSLYRNEIPIMTNHRLGNITAQSLCLNPSKADGDTFVFSLDVYDIMNHSYTENVSVSLDSSVPEVNEIGLEKDGVRQLFVHSNTDLSKMVLSFDAFDIHSGINDIMWLLKAADDNDVLGIGAIGVKHLEGNETCTADRHCYCPSVGVCEIYRHYLQMHSLVINDTHQGNHNRRYIISLKVTNTALLSVIEHIDILLDDSPPEVGVVMEGPENTADVDYTDNEDIEVHWNGFIDHESGIKFYKVFIGETCVLPGKISSNSTQQILSKYNTTDTNIRVHLETGNKQYVTVVAYNHAMESSLPVCSDGIIRDESPPRVGNISIGNAEVRESIGCQSNRAWIVRKTGRIAPLPEIPVCNQRCLNQSDDGILSVLPEDTSQQNISHDVSSFLCERLPAYNNSLFYIPADKVTIRWNIEDIESQIDKVQVAFGGSIESKESPEILGYEDSHNRRSFTKYHTGLGDGTVFYAFIKAQNKAGLTNVAVFGPIIIDETPPVCPTDLPVIVRDGEVVMYWSEGTFSDVEQSEEIGSLMFQIENGKGGNTPFYEWRIHESVDCPLPGKRCVLFPVQRLQNLDTVSGLQFYFNVHAYNYANHFCYARSMPFEIPSQYPPGHGFIVDVNPLIKDSRKADDTDVSFSKESFCLRFGGFRHHENITFMIGLGTQPGTADVFPFQIQETGNTSCQNVSSLQIGIRYFATVIASCSGGNTTLSSDGFVIFDKEKVLESIRVSDGKGMSEQDEVESISLNKTLRASEVLDIELEETLHIGKFYSFITYPRSTNISLSTEFCASCRFHNSVISFMSTDDSNVLKIKNNGDEAFIEKIVLYEGSDDIDFQTSTDSFSAHWSMGTEYVEYVSYFKVAIHTACGLHKLCQIGKTTITRSLSHTTTTQNLVEGRYLVSVQPCFGNQCLSAFYSNGVLVTYHKPTKSALTSTLYQSQENCHNIKIMWEPFECPSMADGNRLLFYKYGVYKDKKGINLQGQTYASNETMIDRCLGLPDHPHRSLYSCVEGFCASGTSDMECVQINVTVDPNTMSRETIYDVNIKDSTIKKILPAVHSRLLGTSLFVLEENDVDFTTGSISLGGVLLGQEENITWFLTTERNVPNSNCEDDSHCIANTITDTGYVEFNSRFLKAEGAYYICAEVSDPSENETITLNGKREHWCSDGFLVDRTHPEPGSVQIKSNQAGYVTDGSELYISWTGFKDNEENTTPDFIRQLSYEYTIGTYPYGEDIQIYTNVGHSTAVIARNVSMRTGHQYYATVKGRDAVGLEVKVTSNAVFLDNTPPITGMIRIGDIHRHRNIVSNNSIIIHWMGFSDPESGIAQVDLGIGNHPLSDDVVDYSAYESEFAELKSDKFQDGHVFYASVKVTNRAGLSTVFSSDSFVVDSSPPSLGVVMDGASPDNKPYDVDFQANTTSITSYWTGFVDPHSGILHYRAGLGVTPGLANERPMVYVGLQTTWVWHSNFIPGIKYYVIVEACNGALLCRSVTSNGITLDNSPPKPGLVFVGSSGHSKYISHSKHLQAVWVAFDDPESEIDHFEVCVGFHGNCDVMDFMNVLLASSILTKHLDLPVGVPLHVKVRAYNRVGLYVDRLSDSFIVDVTPPVVMNEISFFQIVNGSLSDVSYQRDPSYISFSWGFLDDESPIVDQTLWLTTHRGGHASIESSDVRNSNKTTVIMKDPFKDGDKYSVRIIACNAAGLCSSSVGEGLLIDSSPPVIGGFKPHMSWNYTGYNTSEVILTWYGFHDPESGLKSYYITIGETFSGAEISDGILRIEATQNASQEIHTFCLNHSVRDKQKIVLSIWADNNVDINSTVAKATVIAVPGDIAGHHGELLLERHSCDVDYCTKDCTCAVVGERCADINLNMSCSAVNESLSDLEIDIQNAYRFGNRFVSISAACMEASWYTASRRPIRNDWTIGILDLTPGDGVFDPLQESVWHDVGTQTNFKFCFMNKKSFEHDEHYVVYLRIWLSHTQYIIHKSHPILIDLTPPAVRRGKSVMDTDDTLCTMDAEFSKRTDTLTACWKNTFSDQQSSISNYVVSLGSVIEGDDVVKSGDIGLNTTITWTNLSLSPGVRYYVTVIAINKVGLSTKISSDGLLIDNKRPTTGVVFNTERHTNMHTQSDAETVGVSWHGFDDHHSFIREYAVAVVSCNQLKNLQSSTSMYTYVGLMNSINITGLQLVHGERYCALVKAVDAAGYESYVASTPPLLIDTTPPSGYTCGEFHTMYNSSIHLSSGILETWTDNITFARSTFYKFDIAFEDMNFDSRIVLEIEDFVTILPLNITDEVQLHSSYLYLSSFERYVITSITFHDFPNDTNGYLTISRCNEHLTHDVNQQDIMLDQISSTDVAVCMRILDLESGIRSVMLGSGTHPGGFQLKPLTPSSLLHHTIIEVDVSHGSPLYITIIIENYAGLTKVLTPDVVIIDQTPPEIRAVNVTPVYNTSTNATVETIVSLSYHWVVQDEQSDIRQCQVKIGSIIGAENILPWTHAHRNGTFTSPALDLHHGDKVFSTIRCINSIDLIREVSMDPITISYEPPKTSGKAINIIPQNKNMQYNSKQSKVQSNLSSVMVTWDEFDDISSSIDYQCRLRQGNRVAVPWRSSGRHNLCRLNDLMLDDHEEYSLEVIGQNMNFHQSECLNTVLLTDSSKPSLTGQSVQLMRSNDSNCQVSWNGCFVLDPRLNSTFKISVGRREGYADILKEVVTHDDVMNIDCDNTDEIYIRVIATYVTGESSFLFQRMLT